MSELPKRFWANIDRSGDCWLWTAGVTANGYGKTCVKNRQVYAHRASYAALVGPIPEGAQIDHKCHQKRCVRPEHLQPVDNRANAQNRAGAQANSGSGVRGVHWIARAGKWRVQVKADGRTHSGGLFAELTEATEAALALRNRLMTNNLVDRTSAPYTHI